MCQNLTLLTKDNPRRFVSQCEHTAVHINWDNFAFSVGLQEFHHLTSLLEKAVVEVNPIKISEGRCCLVQLENGQVQLWLGDTGLLFTLSSFLNFVELVRRAARQLKTSPPKPQIWPVPLKRQLLSPHYSLN